MHDASAPMGRVIGRWITHVCVWLETLSFDIQDSMCGLRVYPLAALAELLDGNMHVGKRMDFDIEALVRLHRAGVPMVSHPVRVTYLQGNLSNFRLWRDNWSITKMHTRLMVGGLFGWMLSSPARRRDRGDDGERTHWSALAERGLYWGLRASALAYRLLGRRACMAILSLVVLYFYVTAGERRHASLAFLRRAFARSGHPRPVGWLDGYRHFLSFARRALDSFAAWSGGMPAGSVVMADTSVLDDAAAQARGAVFIVSHHGNVDISRALLDAETRRRVVVLLHTRHAEHYNRILREFNPDAAINTFQVTEFGPDTAIALQERVERGEWLFIAGDRTPVGGGNRVSVAPFLGADAEFSQGPYLIAALLDCPVYLFFCQREKGPYALRVERLAERIVLPRGKRLAGPRRLCCHLCLAPERDMCWPTRSSGTTFTTFGACPRRQRIHDQHRSNPSDAVLRSRSDEYRLARQLHALPGAGAGRPAGRHRLRLSRNGSVGRRLADCRSFDQVRPAAAPQPEVRRAGDADRI